MSVRSRWLCFGLAIAVIWFCVREARNEIAIRRAFPVVRVLGGRIGSLPLWPIGCEYAISFHGREFTDDELQRLAVLNELPDRNYISITFSDTNLTAEHIPKLQKLLPRCSIRRYVKDEFQDDQKHSDGEE